MRLKIRKIKTNADVIIYLDTGKVFDILEPNYFYIHTNHRGRFHEKKAINAGW